MIIFCRTKRTGNIHSAFLEMELKAAEVVPPRGSYIFHLKPNL